MRAHFAKITKVQTIGFTEDVVAVERMQKLLDDDTTDFTEMSIAGDKAGTLFPSGHHAMGTGRVRRRHRI